MPFECSPWHPSHTPIIALSLLCDSVFPTGLHAASKDMAQSQCSNVGRMDEWMTNDCVALCVSSLLQKLLLIAILWQPARLLEFDKQAGDKVQVRDNSSTYHLFQDCLGSYILFNKSVWCPFCKEQDTMAIAVAMKERFQTKDVNISSCSDHTVLSYPYQVFA